MALFMLISSTFAPLKASAGEVENKNEIETIMSQESPQENNENLIEESTPSLSEDIDDSEKEKSEINTNEDVINDEISNKEESKPSVDKTEEDKVLEKTETAELYKDSSYNELLDEDFEIKIKGSMPENAIIKAYMVKDSDFNLKEDRENILSFAYEIFDKNGDIYSQLDSSRYEIEIKSNKFTEDNEIYLYEKGVDELEFEENKNFDFYDKKIRFETTKNQFLIQNKVWVQEEEELENVQVEDGVEEKKDDKNRKSPVYLEQKEQLKETQTNLETNLINKLIDELLNIDDKLSKNEGSDIVESRKDLIDSLKVNDSDKKEDNDNSASIIELNKDKRLTYQQVLADIYTDRSYSQKAKDQTRIKIAGDLPGFTKVKAYPVEIEIEGKEILAAYDITIFDENDEEYKVSEKNDINVQITNQKIKEAEAIEVYHKEDELAPEEKIEVDSKTLDTVSFKADSFSIYAITDPEAQAIKFVFLNRNKDGDREVWDIQTVRNGEKLIQPELPIFSYKGKFEGWHYYNIETDTFGEKFDFDKPVTVTESSPKIIYLKGKYPDVAYIDFIDRKEVENSDGTISYVDEVLSTKEIPLGDKVTTDDVPVLPGESGTVFSHWALEPEGSTAFDFNTPITKEYVQSVQGADNFVRLDLYAVFKKALTVTFDSQGGTHVNKQVVYSGDKLSLSDLTKPVRPGYNFKYWATSPNGRQFNANTPITKDTTLYAVWTPRVVKYTINHFMENADDSGYSLYKSETRTATAGTYTNADSGTYKLSNTIMNNEKIHFVRADERKIIRGDDSTEINLYYDRDRFTFRIFESYVLYEIDVVKVELKWGADTKPYFEEALRRLPSGYTFKENGIGGQMVTSPPRMPKNNYQLLAWREGSNEWNVRIIDVETNQLIRLDAKTSRVSSSLQGYTGGELIPGYTYKYVERPGNDFARPSTRHADGKESEQNEVWVYYQRNRHDLTFSTNGNGPDIIRSNVLYDSSLAQYAPENYIIGQTKNGEGQIFAGWFENSNGAGNPVDLKSMTMPDNNVKLYAKWEEPVYTVRAYRQRNNPEAGVIELKVKRGDTVDKSKLSADKPPVAEQTKGSELRWYAFINGTLTEYNFSDPVYSDLFLYPVWLAPVGDEFRPLSQIYRVKYKAPQEDGTDYIYTDPNDYVNNAEAIVIPPYINNDYRFPPDKDNPTGKKLSVPKDKVFEGWVIDKNSEFTSVTASNMLNKIYQPGDIINVIGNIMFKPVFNEFKTTKLTLKEIAPDGSKLNDIIYESRSKPSDLPNGINDNRPSEDLRNNDTITLPQPKATNTTGFHFLGWSTTEDPTQGRIFNPGQEVMITDENMPNILYGIWERDKYTLKITNNVKGDDISAEDNQFTVSYILDGINYEDEYTIPSGEFIEIKIPYGSKNIKVKSHSNRYVKYKYNGETYNSDTLDLSTITGNVEVIFENAPIPPPTGIIDNIAPMALMLALAIMAFAYRLYRKNKLAGGIDE